MITADPKLAVLSINIALSTKIAELNAIKKQMEKKLACGDSETDEISCEPSDSNDSINARKSLRRVFKLIFSFDQSEIVPESFVRKPTKGKEFQNSGIRLKRTSIKFLILMFNKIIFHCSLVYFRIKLTLYLAPLPL